MRGSAARNAISCRPWCRHARRRPIGSKRANVLLACDSERLNWSDEQLAGTFDCRRNTVANVRQRLWNGDMRRRWNGSGYMLSQPQVFCSPNPWEAGGRTMFGNRRRMSTGYWAKEVQLHVPMPGWASPRHQNPATPSPRPGSTQNANQKSVAWQFPTANARINCGDFTHTFECRRSRQLFCTSSCRIFFLT